MRLSNLNLLWKLTPNWLGHIFMYLSGGWIWTQELDHKTNKPLRYYWQRRWEIKSKFLLVDHSYFSDTVGGTTKNAQPSDRP